MRRLLVLYMLLLLTLAVTPLRAGFTEVTQIALGAGPGQIAGGEYVAWPDADGDGWPDLHLGSDILYLNNGDGTFTLTQGVGLEAEWGHDYRMSWADADNDGDQDCVQSCDLVTTTGRTTGIYYFDNLGQPGLSFSRTTIYLNPTNLRSESPVFFDADGDGSLEFYQAIFGNWAPNYTRGADRFFSAAEAGAWDDVTDVRIPQLGEINYERQSRGVAVCDHDGDLDLDIFVPVYGVATNDPSWENMLWQNDGNGRFSDTAASAGVNIEPHGRYGIGLASGASWGDYDNDGDFDLVVANIHGRAAIFRNEGDGTFYNTCDDDNGLPTMQNEWHSAIWLDHDNDGDLDLFLCQWYEHLGHVFENQGPGEIGTFVDVTESLGLEQDTLFRQLDCLSGADFDRDGDVDLYFHGGLDQQRGQHLLRNDLDPGGSRDHWLGLQLEGDPESCGLDAVGASARLVFDDGFSGARQVETATGDGTMNMRPLHFGLGERSTVSSVLVSWPYGGVERFVFQGAVDRYLTLRQGEGAAVDGLLVVTGPGPAPGNPPTLRSWSALAPGGPMASWDAYGVNGYGVNVACADLDGDGMDELLSGPGPGDVLGPHVRAFTPRGTPISWVSFLAYGTSRFGVNVAGGDLDGDGFDEIVTGAGPGEVFGPHVRGWNSDGSGATPIPGISFFAYGTPKWGVNVCCGDLDGDGFDEIVTGAGPGAVYGPHVRGWNVDGGAAVPIPAISYFAYGTLKYGVNVACGDLDGDGLDEIITGAGPGSVFGAHVRGFTYDGASVTPLPQVNFFAYSGSAYGVEVAAADLDGDGNEEILTMPGPDPAMSSRLKAWNADGAAVAEVDLFDIDAFWDLGLGSGGTVAGGRLY